jgi:hypothetical protein
MVDLRAEAKRGALERALAREGRAIRAGVKEGIGNATRSAQLKVRSRIDRAFAATGDTARRRRKVGNAIRSKLFDNRDGAAGFIYSKFGKKGPGGQFLDYLLPFITGAKLGARRAKFLFISLERRRASRRRSSRRVGLDPTLKLFPDPKAPRDRFFLAKRGRGKRQGKLLGIFQRNVKMPRILKIPSEAELAGSLPQDLAEAIERNE